MTRGTTSTSSYTVARIMECSKENSGKSTHLIYFLKKLGNDSKEAFHLNNAKLLKCWLTILQK